MPRFGSVWLDAVCLVPNPASVVMIAWIRAGSISLSTFRRSGSNPWPRWRRPQPVAAALAAVAWATRGAATAVAAEAARNARRLGRFRSGMSWFSMPPNQALIHFQVKKCFLFGVMFREDELFRGRGRYYLFGAWPGGRPGCRGPDAPDAARPAVSCRPVPVRVRKAASLLRHTRAGRA